MNASSRGYLLPAVIALGLGLSILSVLGLQAVSQGSQSVTTQSYKNIAHEAALAGMNIAKGCVTDPRFGNTTNAIWPKTQANLTSASCNGTDVQKVVDDNDSQDYTSTYSVTLDSGTSTTPTTLAGSGISGYTLHSTGTVRVKTPVGGFSIVAATDTVNAFVQVSNTGSISRDVKQVSANNHTTCTIATTRDTSTDNTRWWPYCWGDNQFGQLGIGYFLDDPASQLSGSTIPKAVSTAASVANPGSSQVHPVCYGATIDSGLIGLLNHWQPACLGFPGVALDYKVPAANGGNSATNALNNAGTPRVVTKISVGVDHTCAIARNNAGSPTSARAYCWGRNDYGQLGTDSTGNMFDNNAANEPVMLPQAVSEKWTEHVPADCVYLNPIAWGYFTPWGSCIGRYVAPYDVTHDTDIGGKVIVDIVAGNGFTCAKYINTSDSQVSTKLATPSDALANSETVLGQLACWGRNDHMQLGVGDRSDRQYAVNVSSGTGLLGGRKVQTLATVKDTDTTRDKATSVAATMCATDDTNKAYCWGQNDTCQAGSASGSCASLTQYTDIYSLPGSYSPACGIGADPWIITSEDISTPTQVQAGSATFRSLTVGNNWTTGITASNSPANPDRAYFWGGTTRVECGTFNDNVRHYFPNAPTLLSIGGGSAKTSPIGTQQLGLSSGLPSRDTYDPDPTAAPIRGIPFCAVVSSVIQCANIVPYPTNGGMLYSTGSPITDMDTSTAGYSCAISTDAAAQGSVSCWGTNLKGSLGNRTLDAAADPTHVDIYRGYTDAQADNENSALGFPAAAINATVYF